MNPQLTAATHFRAALQALAGWQWLRAVYGQSKQQKTLRRCWAKARGKPPTFSPEGMSLAAEMPPGCLDTSRDEAMRAYFLTMLRGR